MCQNNFRFKDHRCPFDHTGARVNGFIPLCRGSEPTVCAHYNPVPTKFTVQSYVVTVQQRKILGKAVLHQFHNMTHICFRAVTAISRCNTHISFINKRLVCLAHNICRHIPHSLLFYVFPYLLALLHKKQRQQIWLKINQTYGVHIFICVVHCFSA